MTIRGNQVRNCGTAISFEGIKVNLPFSLIDVVVEGNDLFDWTTAAIRFYNFNTYPTTTPSAPSVSPSQRVLILNNRADGDPFHKHPERKSDRSGKWKFASAGSFVNVVTDAAEVAGSGMLVIIGNHVRNVSQAVAGLEDTLHVMRDSVGYCDPADVKYDANNAGIGYVIEPARGWHYVIEYGVPTQANYGQLINTCPLAASTAPTGGKWVKGMIVTNLTPNTGSVVIGTTGVTLKWEVSGWRCLKTGSTTSLDWREQRVMIP